MTIEKPIVDKGSHIAARKPVGLRVYRPEGTPAASDCPQALIVANDSGDGAPRGRLALSNGSSWDGIAFSHELEALRDQIRASSATVQVIQPPAAQPNVAPMVELALSRLLPQMVPQVVQAALPPPQPVQQVPVADVDIAALMSRIERLEAEKKTMAAGILELGDQLRDLIERVVFIEQHAAANVHLEEQPAA